MKKMLQRIRKKGVSIRAINICMIASMILLCGLLLYLNIKLQSEWTALTETEAVFYGNSYDGQLFAESGNSSLAFYIKVQRIGIIVMILAILMNIVIFYTQVIGIIKKHVQCVACGEPLEGGGACELRYLAASYNDKSENRSEKERKLRRQVDKDTLTGVVNRGTFEEMVGKILADKEEKGCLLLVDVDNLEEINESYSRDMGDTILRNVAQRLTLSFRSCDYIGRLGSDEFALWLAELSGDSAGYIRTRIAAVNDRLMHPEKGIPPVSLSVGAAFGEAGDEYKSLYKKADTALYRVKVGGRCGFEAYKE